MARFSALFLCIFLPILVHANTHFHDFVVKETNLTRLCKTDSKLVVNGIFPGPTIYVNKGDTVFVNVHNQGSYGLSIHWHGVNQPRNPWSDGPEFITQCPIEPGKNFTYEIIFSEEEGTLWWHAHSNWTRHTVHGAIVIYPEEGEIYPFLKPDGEEILVLASWYNYSIVAIVEADTLDGQDFPSSDAYVINGQPGDLFNCSKDSTHRIKVDYGKTYLMRIVNAIMNAEIFLGVAGHNMTVVNTDGAYLKPFSTSFVMISPGQTMDVLITTNQTPSEYYIAFHQFYSGSEGYDSYDKTMPTAILEYSGNYTVTGSPTLPTLPSFTALADGLEFNNRLLSLASAEHPVSVPTNVTTRMFVTIGANYYSNEDGDVVVDMTMNNVSWSNPTVDILQAYYSNISGIYTDDFPDQPPYLFDFTSDVVYAGTSSLMATKVKVLEYGQEVEIIYQNICINNATENHPMHFHGHSFYVVGFGLGNFDADKDPSGYNLVDPPYVNTASLPRNGWLTIRFTANNPGVWLWHCHVERHLSWGMDTVLIVKNGGTPDSTIRDPPPNMPSCATSSSSIRTNKYNVNETNQEVA